MQFATHMRYAPHGQEANSKPVTIMASGFVQVSSWPFGFWPSTTSLPRAGFAWTGIHGAEVLASSPHTLHHVFWQIGGWLHCVAASEDELPLPVLEIGLDVLHIGLCC